MAMPHPLKEAHVLIDAPAGGTVEEALWEVHTNTGADAMTLGNSVVLIGGEVCPKAAWATREIAPGEFVVVRTVAGKGFAKWLLIVAAIAVTWYFFGPQAALKLAGTIGLSMGLQALQSTPEPYTGGERGKPADGFTLSPPNNQLIPYGPIPICFGAVDSWFPPYAALPYTMAVGGEQDVCMLFSGGYGKNVLSNPRFGNMPGSRIDGFLVEYNDGTGSTRTKLFPRDVYEETINARLKKEDGAILRRTQRDIDEYQIDIAFPQGLERVTSRNVHNWLGVQFAIQHRGIGNDPAAFTNVTPIPGAKIYDVSSGQFEVRAKMGAASRASIRVPAEGQFEIKLQRLTDDDQSIVSEKDPSSTREESWFGTLRSIRYSEPWTLEGTALAAMRARATNRLNGVPDNVRVAFRRWLPVWDGSTWTVRETRSPVWAYVWMLTGQANPYPIDYSRIDLDDMLEWDAYCEEEGLTCDGVISSIFSVWDILNMIAFCGHAIPDIRDGLYTVTIDRERDTTQVVQSFTPENTWDYSWVHNYGRVPHGLKIEFQSNRDDGMRVERTIYDEGYSEENATLFESVRLPLCNEWKQAARHGYRMMAAYKLRPGVHQFKTDAQWLACRRGSLVSFSHDVSLYGAGQARAKALTTDGGGNVTTVTFAHVLETGAGVRYQLRVRKNDGRSLVIRVDDPGAGEFDTFTITTPAAAADSPAVGDLCQLEVVGTGSFLGIVRTIEVAPDYTATITIIKYDARVYSEGRRFPPDYDPDVTIPPPSVHRVPDPPTILGIVSDERAMQVDASGNLVAGMLVGLDFTAAGTKPMPNAIRVEWTEAAIEAHWRSTGALPLSTTSVLLSPVEAGETYLVRAQTVTADGVPSEWTSRTHVASAANGPPPAISRLWRQGDFIAWTYDPPFDHDGFVVRLNYGDSDNWATGAALHAGPYRGQQFYIGNLTGAFTIMVRPIDLAGNVAESSALLYLNTGDAVVTNLVYTQDEDAGGFAGDIVDATVSGGALVADAEPGDLIWTDDNALIWTNDAALLWTSGYKAMQYTATYTTAADHVGAIVKLNVAAVGNYAIEFRRFYAPLIWTSDTDLIWTDDAALLWSTIEETWEPWAGELGPIAAADENYQFRVTIMGGPTQGEISNFDIVIDVPDLLESFSNVAIAATGTVRIAPTKAFRTIKHASISLDNDGGTAAFWRIFDYDPTLGPKIETYDAAGTRVAAHITGQLQGTPA